MAPKVVEKYDASSIRVLEGLTAVRHRPGMYIGSTGEDGLHHMVWELVDNATDEASAGHCSRIDVTLQDNGAITVADNGRGIPTEKHETGRSALTVVLTTLHAGGKFEDNGAYKAAGGLHGVGVSVVCALSERTSVTVRRGRYVWEQRFARGEPETPDPQRRGKRRAGTGTTVTTLPDSTIFEATEFDYDTIADRLETLSYLQPGLLLTLACERTGRSGKWESQRGLADWVAAQVEDHVAPPVVINSTAADGTVVDVAMAWTSGEQGLVVSYANNVSTISGGVHEEGFKTAVTRTLNDHYQKGRKVATAAFAGDDIREGLVAAVSVKVGDPLFEGQTKTRLTNPSVRAAVRAEVTAGLGRYLASHPSHARSVLKRVGEARRARRAAQRARSLVRRRTAITSDRLPGKLADCATGRPEHAELFIVEGDSAAGPAKNGRDASRQAILPIRGKILNVEKANLAKTLANAEIGALIAAIGGGVGDKFNLRAVRYHKVILLCDADVDGAHIRTLLLTFFFRHMRPMMEAGYVYTAVPPLYRVKVGQQVRYLADDSALDRYKKGGGKGTIARFKGLGEMNVGELTETSLAPETRTLRQFRILDGGPTGDLFATLMGGDVAARKQWIVDESKARGGSSFLDI